MNLWLAIGAVVCLVGQGHAWSLGNTGNQAASMMKDFMQPHPEPEMRPMNWGMEFYNWGSRSVKKCPPNVMFIVDGSESVSQAGFDEAKEYLKREIRAATSSFANTDVGVIFFSNGVYREFPLKSRDNVQLQQLYSDIDAITQPADSSELTTALKRAIEVLSRHETEGNVIVVLSDGCPFNMQATVNAALHARMAEIYVIGLGIEKQDLTFQRRIARRAQTGSTPIDWSDILICPSVMLPGIDTGSSCRDFMFVVDGSDSMCEHEQVVKRYLKSAVHRYENVSNSIGAVVYGTEIGGAAAPNSNKEVVIAEINGLEFPRSGSKTTTGIREAQRMLDRAGRSAEKALVLVTDGAPMNLDNAIDAVTDARNAGYEIIVIGIGDRISQNELLGLAGGNRDRVFPVDTVLEIYAIDFSTILCGVAPPSPVCDNTRAGCVNGNAVLDTFGNCVCICGGGWSGPTCNTRDCARQISCNNGGTAFFNPSRNTCECRCVSSFTGPLCDNRILDCSNEITCMNGGTAVSDQSGGCRCNCLGPYTGSTCNVRDCDNEITCYSGGAAVLNGGRCECSCPPQFTGPTCLTPVSNCPPLQCDRQGTLNEDTENCQCVCRQNFYGSDCSQSGPVETTTTRPGHTCTSLSCSDPGTESRDVEYCRCRCKPGYTGDSCENELRTSTTPGPGCTRLGCYTPGTERRDMETCTCICRPGFSGFRCQDVLRVTTSSPATLGPYPPVDPCPRLACDPTGTSRMDTVSCRCICRPTFSGRLCQNGPRIQTTRPPRTRPTRPPRTRATRPPQTRATRPPRTRPTRPPRTRPTRPPRTRATRPPQTRATRPPQTRATRPPRTRPTRPPRTRPTRPPRTRPTRPPRTRPTRPPRTRATRPPRTRPTRPPRTRATRPPQTRPTRPSRTRPTRPPRTRPTRPPRTRPTIPPRTRATIPPRTRATIPPRTRPTRPPHTGSTRPPRTRQTRPPRTRPTRPPRTRPTRPPRTRPTTQATKCPNLRCEDQGTRRRDMSSCRCICNPGYRGRTCSNAIRVQTTPAPTRPTPPCSDLSCDKTGTLRINYRLCRCICKLGYSGPSCDTEPLTTTPGPIYPPNPSCPVFNCMERGTRRKDEQNCLCVCLPGFSGRSCQIVNNPPTNPPAQSCTSLVCSTAGTLYRDVENCQCVCKDGFGGDSCEEAPRTTPGPATCNVRSLRCVDANTDREDPLRCQCVCKTGYSGERCQTGSGNSCGSVYCNRGGTIRMDDNCKCVCRPGYQGPLCTPSVDPCANIRCQNGGSPRNAGGRCICDCPPLFTGDFCEQCGPQIRQCENGGFRSVATSCQCSCPSSYSGFYCEIGQCDSFTCSNGGRPFQQPNGGCGCECTSDYVGENCNCPVNRCGSRGTVNPTDCRCNCFTPFTGATCNICDASATRCTNGELIPVGNTCECRCFQGFSGIDCSIEPRTCTDVSAGCTNNGRAFVDSFGNCVCQCPAGTSGLKCEIQDCSQRYCDRGSAYFDNNRGECRCDCEDGYTGESCEIPPPRCSLNCLNGGRQSNPNDQFCTCICPQGFTGSRCESRVSTCSLNCLNGGRQSNPNDQFCTCICPQGFTGSRCESRVPTCSLNCLNGGRQSNPNDQFCTCICPQGFTGSRCESRVPTCGLNCLNGGRQSNPNDQFCTCLCPREYTGPRCEIEVRDDPTPSDCPSAMSLCSGVLGATVVADCHGRCICRCPQGYAGYRCQIELRPEMCDDCLYENGIGYAGVEGRCDLFVRCRETASGGQAQEIFECPINTLWDKSILACNHANEVDCPNDLCKTQPFGYKYSTFRECQAFMQCANGATTERGCCDVGMSFNESSQSCVPDSNCPDSCKKDATSLAPCGTGGILCPLEIDDAGTGFWQVTGNTRVHTDCPSRTVFDQTLCVCVLDTQTQDRTLNCEDATWPIEFNNKPNGSVVFENIKITDNTVARGADDKAGYFTGNSRAFLYPTAHAGFHYENFVIRARINTDELTSGENYAVVSNGDCGKEGSVDISVRSTGSNSGIATFSVVPQGDTEPTTLEVNFQAQDGWATLELGYMLNENDFYEFTGKVRGAQLYESSTEYPTAVIDTRMCPIQIGQGEGLTSFKGYMDWVRIWMDCKPTGSL